MARIQHPRATDAFDRGPPSTVAVPIGGGRYLTRRVDDEGYLLVEDKYAEATMDGLEDSFDVEYDRDTGDVVGADPDDDPDGGGDEPPDDSETSVETGADISEGDADGADATDDQDGDDDTDGADADAGDDQGGDDEDAGDDEADVEAWANWDAESWLAMDYQQREADVLEGRVDDHLQEVYDAEENQSKTVREAVEDRAGEINYTLEGAE